jgi:hypothetical protein
MFKGVASVRIGAYLIAATWLVIVPRRMLGQIVSYFGGRELFADACLLTCLALIWFKPPVGNNVLDRIENFGSRAAERKRWAIAWMAGLTILVRLGLLGLLPAPIPRAHDEFSYLLAADTFAHGRLTNPTHSMWIFFDTIHVNPFPTYMSKYQPAQGAMLALGQLLGRPWLGVLISVAVMCAALVWALQGWLPARWALLGGVLALLRLGVFSYWINSYWGGAVPAIGGAFVVGALPRIVRFRRSRDAVILGLGTSVLVNSRPMEGLVLILPVMAAAVFWMWGRHSPAWRVTLWKLTLPFCAVMLICGMSVCYYNRRVTGNCAVFPYLINEQTYVSTPTLFWEKPRAPLHYLNPQFEGFYNDWMHAQWLDGRVDSVSQAVKHLALASIKTVYFFLWPELCVPLLALPWLLRDRKVRFLIILAVISFLGFLLVPWTQAHYAAPLTAILFTLLTQAIRHIRLWRQNGRLIGVGISRVVVLFAAVLAPIHPHTQTLGHPSPEGIEFRARFEAALEAIPGKHLVIVRYSRNHDVLQEWVYNRSDIDQAKVIWAREIPGVDTRPLLNYFRGHSVWLAEPDLSPPRLAPYSEGSPP